MRSSLLRLVVSSVLSAESAVLLHFETVGVILLVLHGVVVSLLALGASQSDFNAHIGTSLKIASLYHSAHIRILGSGTTIPPELKNGRNKKALFSQVKPFYHRGCTMSTTFLPEFRFFGNFFWPSCIKKRIYPIQFLRRG